MVKVISIQDDVYAELSKHKDNKSFSQVIRELIKASKTETSIGDLSRFYGILRDEDAEKIDLKVREGRKNAVPRELNDVN
ncbi:MAG: antitoxin VapB family protein [Candidatus Thermoplasmatota archaeon]|nr:antitoxin VapB family protein [Candidatus Thermoplasmatota archaeon]